MHVRKPFLCCCIEGLCEALSQCVSSKIIQQSVRLSSHPAGCCIFGLHSIVPEELRRLNPTDRRRIAA